jgi:hypothetical protein
LLRAGKVRSEMRLRILLEPNELQGAYSTGMNKEQKSDTAQVLWMDAVVILIIAVIAIVSHHGR